MNLRTATVMAIIGQCISILYALYFTYKQITENPILALGFAAPVSLLIFLIAILTKQK